MVTLEPSIERAEMPEGQSVTGHSGPIGDPTAVADPSLDKVKMPECQSDAPRFGERGRRYADPQAFGHLLNLIADRGISLWFDDSGMHWSAPEDAVDAELLRLLRRFRESLRQAYGLDRLPLVDPEEAARLSRGRRKVEEGETPVIASAVCDVKTDPDVRNPGIPLPNEPAIAEAIMP